MTDNLTESLPALSKSLNSLLAYVEYHWSQIDNYRSFAEIGIIAIIFFLSQWIQKFIKRRYLANLVTKNNYEWYQRLIFLTISFSAPIIAFILLTFTMSISAGFTNDLEIYKFSIKLTMIWFAWIFVTHMIPDLFVRLVATITLIPFLILSALGFATPVLTYLDTLALPIGQFNLSLYLILKGLFVATCLFWLAKQITKTASSFIASQSKITDEIRDLLENLFQVLVYTTVILITLNILGIDLRSLAIVGGAIGIGIGLGLQKIAANFISGFIILFEQNVKVGHLVEVQGSGKPGWIRHLGARSAVIDTDDGRELVIPNEDLLTKTVIDWTSKDKRARTDLKVKVSFNSDLEKAKAIMLDAVHSHPICSNYKSPTCFLEKFTDNGAQFLLQFWVDDLTAGKMDMQNDVLLTIWRRFSEEKIEHPFPLVPDKD